MFWFLLTGLYIVTLPLNVYLIKNFWYSKYPPQVVGKTYKFDRDSIASAQIRAILLFGIIQPILASIPLLYGSEWYHYLICAAASIAYAASGSPKSAIDRVRSSHIMFLSALAVFGISSVIIKNIF